GTYMGASIKTSNFDGKESSAVYIDIYQADSKDAEKMIQLKSSDVSLINVLSKDFAMGSIFECSASVSAYKNKAYYRLLEITA
uniref:hypothetical protein n=1 Tax=Klebsiella pneumoniae TaxID=573 RepID=UPI0013C3551E